MSMRMLQLTRVARNVLLQKPIMAVFDITNLCNQRCLMCNIWKSESDHMPLEKITEIADTLAKFGLGYVYLQGGEPTLRKDLLQIVDILIERGIKPNVNTNGMLLTEDLAQSIAARRCNLSISIDSFDSEVFQMARGVDARGFEQVINNVKRASKITKRGGNWSITTTLTKLSTLDDIKNIRKFCAEHGFMHAIRPYIFVHGTAGKADERLFFKYDDVAEIYDYVLDAAKKENYLAYTVYKKQVEYLKGESPSLCDAMRYSLLIKSDGQISPCLEHTRVKINLMEDFRKQQSAYKQLIENCNRNTPCFYGCSRNIGVLMQTAPEIALHMPKIITQLIKYGNFF